MIIAHLSFEFVLRNHKIIAFLLRNLIFSLIVCHLFKEMLTFASSSREDRSNEDEGKPSFIDEGNHLPTE